MSSRHRSHDDEMERLRRLDPASSQRGWTPDIDRRSALFKEITMNIPTSTASPRLPLLWRRRTADGSAAIGSRTKASLAFLGALSAVAGLLAVAITDFGDRTEHSPIVSAPATLLSDAVEKSRTFESGHVLLAVEYRDLGSEPASGVEEFGYWFDEGDQMLASQFEFEHARGSNPDSEADHEMVDGGPDTYVVMTIDDKGYETTSSGAYEITNLPVEVLLNNNESKIIDADTFIEFKSGIDPAVFDPSNLVPDPLIDILATSSDFSRSGGDAGGVTRYQGTVSADALVAIGDQLPAGLSLAFANDEISKAQLLQDLPATVQVVVEIQDGLMRSAAVELVGETASSGPIDMSIRVEVSGLGEPQGILAPTPDENAD